MTISIVELQKAIQSSLEAVHPRVFYQDAPVNATFPYLVYDLPNSFDDGDTEMFVLDVDGWDRADDTEVVDNLMTLADSALNKYAFTLEWLGNKAGVIIFRDNRLSIIDDDKKIKRRKYVYQVKAI